MHFDPALPINARRDEIRAAIERAPGGHRLRRDRLGQDHAAAQDPARDGPRRGAAASATPSRGASPRARSRRASPRSWHASSATLVGYKVRFHDKVGAAHRDQADDRRHPARRDAGRPASCAHTTRIILDEAHERSLNIDFLLGYLKNLLAQRNDLKVVITSATIDAERFSQHFDGAPVIEVSGRLYPVEVRYRPVEGDAEDTTRDEEEQALADAVDELCREGAGDVLVFLPGEREIRDAAEVLRKRKLQRREILPLYSRLSAAEQDRVFKPGGAAPRGARDQRRRDLAHRAAHPLRGRHRRWRASSATATATRSRCCASSPSRRRRRSSAPGAAAASPTASASACTREEDFDKRPAFTDPELLRSSLAAVILRAKSLGLGEVETFPFLDPPSPRAIADGYGLLHELGAVDEEKRAHRRRPGARAPAARPARRRACWSRRAPRAASSRCWSSPRRCRCRTRASGRWSAPPPPTSATRASPTSARTSSPTSSCGSCSRASRTAAACRENFLSYPAHARMARHPCAAAARRSRS